MRGASSVMRFWVLCSLLTLLLLPLGVGGVSVKLNKYNFVRKAKVAPALLVRFHEAAGADEAFSAATKTLEGNAAIETASVDITDKGMRVLELGSKYGVGKVLFLRGVHIHHACRPRTTAAFDLPVPRDD